MRYFEYYNRAYRKYTMLDSLFYYRQQFANTLVFKSYAECTVGENGGETGQCLEF